MSEREVIKADFLMRHGLAAAARSPLAGDASTRAYERLLSIERSLEARQSGPILSCLRLGDTSLTKHNFYVNKFDATAWNDFDAIPRSASSFGLENHGGSRKRLLFARRQATNETNQARMDFAQVGFAACVWGGRSAMGWG